MSYNGASEDGGVNISDDPAAATTNYQPQPWQAISNIGTQRSLGPYSGWLQSGMRPNPAPLYSPKDCFVDSAGSNATTDAQQARSGDKTITTHQESTSGSGSGLQISCSPPRTPTRHSRSGARADKTKMAPLVIVDGSGKNKPLSAAAQSFDPSSLRADSCSSSDSSIERRDIGACATCTHQASYYIVPCGHKICSSCIKPWNNNVKSFCGACGSTVESMESFTNTEKLATEARNRLRRVPQYTNGFQQSLLSPNSPQGGAFGRVVGATNNRTTNQYPNIQKSPDMRAGGSHFQGQMPHTLPAGGPGPMGPSPILNCSQMHRSVSQNPALLPSPYTSFNHLQPPTSGMPLLNRGLPTHVAQQNWQQGAMFGNGRYHNSTASQDSNISFASQVPLPYYMPAGQTPAQSFASPVIPPQGDLQPVPNPLLGQEAQSYLTPNPIAQPGMVPYGGTSAWNNINQPQSLYTANPLTGWGNSYGGAEGQMSPVVRYSPPHQQNNYVHQGPQYRPESSSGMMHSNHNANGGYDNGNNFNVDSFTYNQMVQNQMYHKKMQDATASLDKDSGHQSVNSSAKNTTQYRQPFVKASQHDSTSSSRRLSVTDHNGSYAPGSEVQNTVYKRADNTGNSQQQGNNGEVSTSNRKVRIVQKYNTNAQSASVSKIAGEFGRVRTPIESPSAFLPNVPQTAPHQFGQHKQLQSTPGLRRRNDSVASFKGTGSVTKTKPPPAFNLPTVVDSPVKSPSKVDATSSNVLARLNDDDPFIMDTSKANPNPFVVAPPTNGPASNQLVPYGDDIPGVSRQLRLLTINGQPSIETAFKSANLPFCETARQVGPVKYGVVRISNIPYSVTRAEVLAFLGRNAKVVNEQDSEPVHIVMERVTSKTMDAFIEFVTEDDALNAVNRYDINRSGGRGGRLGERHVELEVVGQEYLMKELFPKARNVHWHGARPEVHPIEPGEKYNSGFKGFVTREELVMLVKHVEVPQRSPFSKDCPQRPFECLISTLYKFPWYMVDHITLKERTQIYNATVQLVTLLFQRVQNNDKPITLNMQLLKRVLLAALKCAGFTQAMKAEIRLQAGFNDFDYQLAPYAEHWLFQTVGPKKGSEYDTIMYFQALLRVSQEKPKSQLSLAEQAAQGEEEECLNVFGPIIFPYPPNVQELTMAAIAKIEWGVIETLLRNILKK